MSKAVKLARSSTKGGFNLFWGVIASSVISALGIIIVAGILSEEEYGLFTIALIVPNLIHIIRDLGIDQSTIKYTAQFNEEKRPGQIINILAAAVTFEFLFGIILSVTSFFLSGYLAAEIFERPDIAPYIQLASLIIFGGALSKFSESAFIGFEQMHFNGIIMIVQAILRTTLMISLVFSGLGVYGAILGHTVAWLLTGLASLPLIYFTLYRSLRKQGKIKLEIIPTLKKMLKYGLPLSGSSILTGFMAQFYAFLVAVFLTDQIVGNYQVAINLAILVGFFVMPVQTILFPAFSKINAKEEQKTLKDVFRFSVKYSSLLIVPATFMIMALSQPIVTTLFQGKYELSPLFLSLYLIIYLYTAFGYLTNGNLIKGQGKSDFHLKLTLLRSLLGVILSLVLTPVYGVIGLISGNLISTIPYVIISLRWIKKQYNATIDWKSSVRILFASMISAAFTYAIVVILDLTSWIILLLGAIIYAVTYLVTAPLMGAINRGDTRNLKSMLKSLGPLATIFNLPLYFIEQLRIKFRKE